MNAHPAREGFAPYRSLGALAVLAALALLADLALKRFGGSLFGLGFWGAVVLAGALVALAARDAA